MTKLKGWPCRPWKILRILHKCVIVWIWFQKESCGSLVEGWLGCVLELFEAKEPASSFCCSLGETAY